MQKLKVHLKTKGHLGVAAWELCLLAVLKKEGGGETTHQPNPQPLSKVV